MSTYDWVEAGCLWTPWLPFCHRSSKPAFGFDATGEILISKAFGRLIRFSRQAAGHRPEVVVVAPMSGNHATLLREVVDTMLDCRDVSLTDWICASQVPLSEGDFGLDDNVQSQVRT